MTTQGAVYGLVPHKGGAHDVLVLCVSALCDLL